MRQDVDLRDARPCRLWYISLQSLYGNTNLTLGLRIFDTQSIHPSQYYLVDVLEAILLQFFAKTPPRIDKPQTFHEAARFQ